MSADLKRVRASQDEGRPSPASKKRALTASGSGGPVVSAPEVESGMEDWMRVVEVKRKEAIYRQMLEYRRSYETEARKVRELDEQRKRLEASVHAVEICWTQLVNAVRTLVPDTDGTDTGTLEPILEPQISQPALEQAIGSRLPATRQLINRFVGLASKNGARTSSHELQEKCLRLQAESSTLRSANQTLQSQLSASTEASDKYRSDLARAQKRLDKQRMEHDLAEQEWRASRDRDRERTGTPGLKPVANGPTSGQATPNGRAEDVKPNLDRAAGMLQDTTELEELADSRLKELLSLRAEHTALKIENDKLRQSAIHPSEESLRSAPFFQMYLQQISQQYARAEAFQQKFEAADSTLDKFRQDNHVFREAVIADCKVEVEQLRKQAQHRNSDLTRIRAERDEMSTELTGRKMQEESKIKWAEELEGMVKSQEVRMGSLSSEIRRLKGELGAGAGSKGYLGFLKADGVDGDYVKSLEEQLVDAQGRMSALSEEPADDIKVELEKVKRALAKYERVFGPGSDAAEDVVRLAQQLESADKEKSALLLQLEQSKSSTNSVYTDLEALDKATQSLQTQLQSKIFDLKDVDARMHRLTTEKAKADNRYFQTMRAREATEAECKAAQRTVEKQLKLLEKAREVEKGLQGQIASHEKGFIAVKNEAASMQNQLATVTSERTQFEIRHQQAQAALSDAQTIMQQRVAEAASEKETRIKLQEEVDRATTALKKLKDRQEHLLASSSSGGSGVSAAELQMKEERDKLLKLLRCSCCEQNFKTQVIVKCMHTFCKPCLDSRVASRQRKCPACGLSFAKEDVQTLYWQ